MRIGLILVGGSVKGIGIHTATVVALRNLGINVDVILGASAGSITGAFMATGMNSDMMKWKMTSLSSKQFLDPITKLDIFKEMVFNHGKKFYGFVKGDRLQQYVSQGIAEKDDFSKVQIPFYVSTTNLKTYKLVLFNTGMISEKVQASCAIPMMFIPKKIENQYYIDGAIYKDKLPKALLGVAPDLDYIIVSNASYDDETDDNSYLENAKIPMVEIVRRTMSMQEKSHWPTKIGKTKLIYLTPGTTVPVDIFNVDPIILNSIYQDSLKYVTFHLERYFKRVKKKELKLGDQKKDNLPNDK